jgi:hypothetical protein
MLPEMRAETDCSQRERQLILAHKRQSQDHFLIGLRVDVDGLLPDIGGRGGKDCGLWRIRANAGAHVTTM